MLYLGTNTNISVYKNIAVINTAVAVKGAAGIIYGYHIFNPGSSLTYVHFYDMAAASVVIGTTNPVLSLALPSTANGQVGLDSPSLPTGVNFTTAISIACTTGLSGSGVPSSSVLVNILYS